MEHLKLQLKLMIHHVEALPPNPSFEQLVKKVRSITSSVREMCRSLVAEIVSLVKVEFAKCGWDIDNLKVTNKSALSVESFVEALKRLYNDVSQYEINPVPSPEELNDISLACSRLWNLDINRAIPNKDYILDLQNGKKPYQKGDVATKPLFAFVDEGLLEKPTYASFIALLDNYEAILGVTESVTKTELDENSRFLKLIISTPVMIYVQRYLYQINILRTMNESEFLSLLNSLWFEMYSRKARNDSSGFEHVFLGEIKGQEIVGMHNWIQIYLEEKKNRFDYQGYIFPKNKTHFPHSTEHLLTIQFNWKGATKSMSSTLFGVSPEFEIAIYTLLFFYQSRNSDQESRETVVQLGPFSVSVITHQWDQNGRKFIATSYPSEPPLNSNEVFRY